MPEDEFVLTNSFYSSASLANHADTLRKTVSIPHSISNTSLSHSLKSSASTGSLLRTSAMKSSPSMKQLESILHQKSEPLSAQTSAAPSIPEIPEEEEEEEEKEPNEKPKEDDLSPDSRSFFSNASSGGSDSVQSFHLSRSHYSAQNGNFGPLGSRKDANASTSTFDADKTPVLQVTEAFDGAETPKVLQDTAEARTAEKGAHNAYNDPKPVLLPPSAVSGSSSLSFGTRASSASASTTSTPALAPSPALTDSARESQDPATKHAKLSSSDTPGPESGSSGSILLVSGSSGSKNRSMLDAASKEPYKPFVPKTTPEFAFIPKETPVLAPASVFAPVAPPTIASTVSDGPKTPKTPQTPSDLPKGTPGLQSNLQSSPFSSMIPDYIPRIQPPKKNTPKSYATSSPGALATPKQQSSTFDSPSLASTPRTPYGRSNSSYSVNFKNASNTTTRPGTAIASAAPTGTPATPGGHKRSSTMGEISSIANPVVTSSKKFSFKSLFRKKEDSAPPSRKTKKPRSYSSPNLAKFTDFEEKNNAMADDAANVPKTPAAAKAPPKSTSSFLGVFKKNKSSDNLLSLKKEPKSPSAKSVFIPNENILSHHTNTVDLLDAPNTNGEFLIREVNDDDYEGNISTPQKHILDTPDDYYEEPRLRDGGVAKKIYNNTRYDHEMTISTPKSVSQPQKSEYKPPSSLAPPSRTVKEKVQKATKSVDSKAAKEPKVAKPTQPPSESTPPVTPKLGGSVFSDLPVISRLAPLPTAPSRFSRVLDDNAMAFGSPFEVKYFSPVQSSKRESKSEQLLGDALFPKSLNAHEVESIISLERSRSMRSFKSIKRNSFVNYDGSNENIIQGDSSISLTSPSRYSSEINRSTSILKNSDSRKNLQRSLASSAVEKRKLLQPREPKAPSALADSDKDINVDHTDKYSFEDGHHYDDFIEFQDFIDVENLNFSPQLSFENSFVDDAELISEPLTASTPLKKLAPLEPHFAKEVEPPGSLPQLPVPELATALSPTSVLIQDDLQVFVLPPSKTSEASPSNEPRIQLPVKTGANPFHKVDMRESIPPPSMDIVDEQPINASLTPNLQIIESAPLSPALNAESPLYESSSVLESPEDNIAHVDPQGKSIYNNRPISMSFKGLNGPSFQGKLDLLKIRTSASHQSFNYSMGDSDVGSGFAASEFDDEDDEEEEEDEFTSGIGNGFGSDDDDEDEEEEEAESNYSVNKKRVPSFDPPPSFQHKLAVSKNGSNNNSPFQGSPSLSSVTSSPRSFSSLISRTWKKQAQPVASPRMPKNHTVVQPVPIRNGVRFSSRIVLYDTYDGEEYDRHPDTATCNQLTPMLAQQIKDELNLLKLSWYVHEQSRCYTHFM